MYLQPAEGGLRGQGLAAYAGEEVEEVRDASDERQIGAGRRICRRRVRRRFGNRPGSFPMPPRHDPPRGHDAEGAVPHLDFEHPIRSPHHEREAPPFALAEERRKVGIGGRPEGGDPTAEPVEQKVHRGGHRQPRCTATIPAFRLKYRHCRNPAARIISSRAS